MVEFLSENGAGVPEPRGVATGGLLTQRISNKNFPTWSMASAAFLVGNI